MSTPLRVPLRALATLSLTAVLGAIAGPARGSTDAGPGVPAFVVDGGTTVRLSGSTRLALDCDLRNTGTFLPAGGSAVVLTGFGSPLLLGASTFADLVLALHGTAAIGNPVGVAGTLDLSSGRLSLAGHHLIVNALTGGSAASYVMTPDTLGRLVRVVGSGAPVAFPVGNAAYDPVSIRTGTGSDAFYVAVLDSPVTTGMTASSALARAWAVSHANAPGVNGDLTASVQWNSDETGASFNRSLDPTTGAWAWRWVDGAWRPQQGMRRSDNGTYPAVDTLVTPDAGLWTLGGVDGLLAVDPPPSDAPPALELSSAFPNPFRAGTSLRYGLPQKTHVTLELYSVLGERVATLADGEQAAGWHLVRFENARLPGGVYFARLQAGAQVRTSKLVLTR